MTMKKLINFTIIVSAIFVASCASDKKEDPISPSTDTRDKFIAHWNVTENSTTSTTPNSYTVNVTKSNSSSSSIIIENFYGLTTYTVYATVNNNNFTIPYQQIKNSTSSTIGFAAGSGTLINSTNINLTYTTAIATNRDSCTATYTK
jgi:PBP1b-binding outer membrane lipoprotein LpoB